MRPVFKVLTVISAFGLTAANAEACKHRIVFLPDTHQVNGIANVAGSAEDEREAATSQLKVINYLDRFPQASVFSEQMVSEDINIDQIPSDKRAALKQMIDGVFPRGFSIDPKQLTDLQKRKLIDNGGEFIQMMRGRLSAIHRVMEDKQRDDKIFGPITQWFATHPSGTPYPREIAGLVWGAREREALKQIAKFFESNPTQRDIILLFGSNHNFSFYPELFLSQCVIVPPEFQDEWKGKFRVGPEGFSDEIMKTGVFPSDPKAAQ